MSLPSVTALCCTYGRTRLLEESIESFQRQDYAGERHMVVVNDLKEQRLVWPACPANVRIVNLDTRLPNLGAKKNVIASFAQTELIINWADDDIHLSNRIAANVAAYAKDRYVTEDCGWWFSNGTAMEYKPGRGLCGPLLMARADYWRLGGMPDADVGEDVKFRTVARQSLAFVASTEPSYIYRWGGTGRYHGSAHRNEVAWEKVAAQVRQTLDSGQEPHGLVTLSPTWRADYETLARTARELFHSK